MMKGGKVKFVERLLEVALGRLTFLVLLLLVAGCATQSRQLAPAMGTQAWMAQVDRVVVTRDAAGHGPDVGSNEWMNTVSRKLGVYDDQGHGPDAGCDEWQRAVHRKAFHAEP